MPDCPDADSLMAGDPSATAVRRALAIGLAVAAGYAAVYVATLRLSDRHQRPLFDGFGPSAPYHWVDPPEEFEQGNVEPAPSTSELPLSATGLPVGQAGTDDGQLVVNLPDGAVPPREGDTSVRIVLTPLAPAELAPLPPNQYSDGNAYRIEMAYQPSGEPIETLQQPGNILLTLPWGAPHLYQSAEGGGWEEVQGVANASGTSLAAPFTRLGTFVAATDTPVGSAGGASDSDGSPWLIVLGIAVLAGALVLVPVLVRRSRRRKKAAKALERRRAAAAKRPERRKPQQRSQQQKKKKKRKR
jgi:hypothetical protein